MNTLPQYGAFGFGLVLGWFLYMVNRYRSGDVGLGDLTTVIGALGGAAVTKLFGDADGSLFGAYGMGLATGFFLYFLILVALVAQSKNFNSDFFLDGRRLKLGENEEIPAGTRPSGIVFDEADEPAPQPKKR